MSESNRLIHESSPYLLQHAHNPVDWYPWGEEALKRAKNENKLILISVGYSACHWCHVMEHESFEDDQVAEIMNKHFICIKVDREERPDIDQVYMSAVQLMTGRGGWPLNCFALPDGKPVFGGTYFPKSKWMELLQNLNEAFNKEPEKFIDYAAQLTQGVNAMDITDVEASSFTLKDISNCVKKWSSSFDNVNGGPNRAPKFPMPNNYLFLLRYGISNDDQVALDHVKLTLKKMAYGGIYDQIGGGFARYSVDGIWKVPHFEKMLYDNAQLISLYSEAFRYFKDPLYEQVAIQTIEFVFRELQDESGCFYSALDADSEGEEGKYYVWSKDELLLLLGADFDLFATYYNINENGYWEEDNYILLRDLDDKQIAEKFRMSVLDLNSKIKILSGKLLAERSKRIKPGLDDKSLTSWNTLMISALLDAYTAFDETSYLNKAVDALNFVLEKQYTDSGKLFRNYKNKKSSINGYLDDYAFLIDALVKAYQCTFDGKWLNKAYNLAAYTLQHFSDDDSELLFFTPDYDPPLFVRQKEVQDNVIPGSNSQMAINFFYLGVYFDNKEFIERSKKMLLSQTKQMNSYSPAYSNWLILSMLHLKKVQEVVFCGINSIQLKNEFMKNNLSSDFFIAGCIDEENIPLTKNRLSKGDTFIYYCVDHSCHVPVKTVPEVYSQIINSIKNNNTE